MQLTIINENDMYTLYICLNTDHTVYLSSAYGDIAWVHNMKYFVIYS